MLYTHISTFFFLFSMELIFLHWSYYAVEDCSYYETTCVPVCNRTFQNCNIMQTSPKFVFFIIKWLPGIAKHADAKPSMKYTPPKSDLGGSKKSFIIEVFMGLWQRKHAIPPSFDQRIYLLDVIGSEDSSLWKLYHNTWRLTSGTY